MLNSDEQVIADMVLKYVQQTDWVTFAELENVLARADVEFGGEHALTFKDPNLVLWANWSETAVNALTHLFKTNQLFTHPTTPLTYFIDGKALRMPVAVKPPSRGYKTEHWLPACLRVKPIGAR